MSRTGVILSIVLRGMPGETGVDGGDRTRDRWITIRHSDEVLYRLDPQNRDIEKVENRGKYYCICHDLWAGYVNFTSTVSNAFIQLIRYTK